MYALLKSGRIVKRPKSDIYKGIKGANKNVVVFSESKKALKTFR